MSAKRYLIVNADDFGHSSAVNRGVIYAHEHGIVTSASLMVRWPAAVEAAEYATNRPGLSLGLHLDFGEWVYEDQNWKTVYHVVQLDDASAVRNEVSHQLAAFRTLTGRDPSHIDSHQHTHLHEPARSVVLEAALEVRAPVRDCSSEIHYCGRFYGQTAEGSPYPEGITSDELIEILSQLPAGVTELACHPGEGQVPNTTYMDERAKEVKALCDLKVRSALIEMGIELCGFTTLPGHLVSTEIGSPTR
jgi:chitin disaccharide deacetylase